VLNNGCVGAGRAYRYVGPDDVRAATRFVAAERIDSADSFTRWIGSRNLKSRDGPFTFIVDLDGDLWLAPRESEHVACARGRAVLAAGEIRFKWRARAWCVEEVSNQSTGYCPDLQSWSAAAAALDRAGLTHPGCFTDTVIFRRCPACGERNVVRDGDFTCALCESPLPPTWNFDD
jgi:hypothetical protein